MEIIEREPNKKHKRVSPMYKCQVQIKSAEGSRSFTAYGVPLDWLYNMILWMMQTIARAEGDSVQVRCYKPPKPNDLIKR